MTADGPGSPPTWATPALAWVATGWVGALLGWHVVDAEGDLVGLQGAWMPAGLVAVAFVVLACLVARRRRTDWAGTGLTAVGVVLVVVVLGSLAAQRRVALADGPLIAFAHHGGTATVLARVVTEPMVQPDGTAWSLVTATSVDGLRGRWRALVPGQQDPAAVGTWLRVRATVRPLADEGFDASLRRRHAAVALDVVDAEVVAAPRGAMAVVERIRSRIRAAAARGLDGDAAGLAVGLVTGDTRQLSSSGQDDMRAAGLTHLVAVSGSNVALVAGAVAALTTTLGARPRRLAVALAILAFVVTTRAEPSVLRAGTMAGVVMGVRMAGRPSHAMHALAVAVLVLLLADPASAGSLGLVLSVAATVGVLVVAPVVAARLPSRLPESLRQLLAATIGAQVTVAPFLVAMTGAVPLAALPANVVAVPAAAVGLMVAVLAALAAQVDVVVGGAVMAVAGPPLQLILAVARVGGGGPVVATTAPLGLAIACAATVAVLARHGGVTRRWSLRLLVAALAVAGASAQSTGWQPPSTLAVTAIDVGQGDALLVTTASGHRMLVDTGRDDRAASWLRQHGITVLDLVVVTHGDADHAGGLDEVLEVVAVPTIWTAVTPEGAAASVWARDWRTRDAEPTAEPDGVVAVSAGHGARLGSATVEVLGPPRGHELVATEGGRNDRSVVLRISEGSRVALLPGDAEHAAQVWLRGAHDDLAADLLVVPHHGAATSDPGFLQDVDPQVAIVSVGADNDYGHPRPEVLAVLTRLGAQLHRTDVESTVTVVVPP